MKNWLTIAVLSLLISSNAFAKYPFLIYYGETATQKEIEGYKIAVLESEHYPDVKKFKTVTLAYISIGEVENFRAHYPKLASMGLLGERNPNWPESRYVTLKGGEWEKILLKELIPSVVSKGYRGVFLDTADSLFEGKNNKDDIVSFINSVKKTYPHLLVMVNRGFEVVWGLNVDAVLFESTITTIDKNKKHIYQPDFSLKIPKKIAVFSCDYWDQNDTEGVKNIYKKALEKKYTPLVTDFSLQKMPKVNYDDSKKTFTVSR